MTTHATITLSVRARVPWRGKIRREITGYCWAHHCEIDVSEDRGWFESVMRFVIRVPQREVPEVAKALSAYAEHINQRAAS